MMSYGSESAVATLKGQAMLAAIDAGMVPKAKTADGYNIKPFLDFWDRFLPMLEKAAKETHDFSEMLHCEREQRAAYGPYQGK